MLQLVSRPPAGSVLRGGWSSTLPFRRPFTRRTHRQECRGAIDGGDNGFQQSAPFEFVGRNFSHRCGGPRRGLGTRESRRSNILRRVCVHDTGSGVRYQPRVHHLTRGLSATRNIVMEPLAIFWKVFPTTSSIKKVAGEEKVWRNSRERLPVTWWSNFAWNPGARPTKPPFWRTPDRSSIADGRHHPNNYFAAVTAVPDHIISPFRRCPELLYWAGHWDRSPPSFYHRRQWQHFRSSWSRSGSNYSP